MSGLRSSFFVLCLLTVLTVPVAAAPLSGQASVIDGDTIEIHGERIRLHGIDAPESAQTCEKASGKKWRCGQQAALALADRIGRAAISCWRTDTDNYGRVIAVCMKGNEDLNGWMVQGGWAVAYRRYSTDYVQHEAQAKEAGRNIWSSDFVMPWDWRRGERLGAGQGRDTAAVQAEQNGCRIKGNINRDGERIYHVPGGDFYSRTRISTEQGERWFCSEAEARSAGWRRSMR